jgi:Uma2 family endonuclease
MTVTLIKWSIEDYHHMIATGLLDDRPVELLNGEIIEMPPEGKPHSSSSTRTAEYLRDLLGRRAQIREGHPITIRSSNSEPEPDLAIVRRDEDNYWDHHPYPADIFWLIEFSDSSLKKDLDPKAKAYAAAEIPEYWVVNLRSMELIVMREPVNGEYQSQVTLTEGEVRPLAFQDVAVALSRLLRTRK